MEDLNEIKKNWNFESKSISLISQIENLKDIKQIHSLVS